VWWSLPGPSGFLDRIADDLADGKHVYLRVPGNEPKRLKAYLKEKWLDHEIYEWRELNLHHFRADADNPVKLLYDIFLPETEPDVIRNAANLARDPAFGGKMIWVEGMTADCWPNWKKFLHDYAEVNRNLLPDERTRFIVLLNGELAECRPEVSVASAVRDWRGTVGQLDMLLYCSSLLRNTPLTVLQKRLNAQLIANLSLWDQNLADYLCDRPLTDLFEPAGLLLEFAEQLEWDSGTGESWQAGTVNEFENRSRIHSAYLAVLGHEQEIQRRVWQAQLSVLFPAIEELRLALIEHLGPVLTVPFTMEQGYVIHDRLDLEIGHIYYQMRSLPQADSELYNGVYQLRKLRNILAHMDPIPKSEIALVDNLESIGQMLLLKS
jgi:hypothetical protein